MKQHLATHSPKVGLGQAIKMNGTTCRSGCCVGVVVDAVRTAMEGLRLTAATEITTRYREVVPKMLFGIMTCMPLLPSTSSVMSTSPATLVNM